MNRRGLLFWIAAPLVVAIVVVLITARLVADSDPQGGIARRAADVRKAYSPALRSDPHFLSQQRANVEALERRCRNAREFCREAAAARAMLADLGS